MGMFENRNPTREEYVATDKTKQSFKDSTDINKILKKAAVKGGLSHVQKYPEAVYGEFDPELDLFVARERIARGEQIFNELPAEVRREFDNDALSFIQFASAPENAGKLVDLIPAIAEPGDYFPNPVKRNQEPSKATSQEAAPPPLSAPSEPDTGE